METEPALLSFSEEQILKAQEAVEEYDFVRFTTADMNGVLRGVLVPGNAAAKFLKSGIGCSSDIQAISPIKFVIPKEAKNRRICNVQAIPDLCTLHSVSWVDRYQVGQVMTETFWDVSTPQQACSRNMARRLLEQLDIMGYRLYTGMELEFILVDQLTQEPVFSGNRYWAMLTQSAFETWFYDVAYNMKKAGISVETMHTESNPGQFEFTTKPKFGIEGPDSALVLKQGIKEMALKKGWLANFMAVPFFGKLGNGGHFNFSIWQKDSNTNAFWDESAEDNLSDFAKYWIAGMIKHAKTLTALCCITTNCYHRLHKPWVPHHANWGVGDRTAMLRVKNDGPGGTYIENRLPSALFNPYLVLAATVAAGIDGVKTKAQCPAPHNETGAEQLPHSLKEALDCLKADTTMVEALGTTFVEWFIQSKTESDLTNIEGVTDESRQIEIEKEEYAFLM